MAQLKIAYDEPITLKSSWSCTIVYIYNSYGAFNSIGSKSQSNPGTATTPVQFAVSLPVGAEMVGAKVHAVHEANWPYGKFKMNNIEPDDEGFVALDIVDPSSGVVDVEFSWQANKDSYSAHDSTYPTYNGSSSQSKTYWHSLNAEIKDVYLLVEYKMNGLIYRAVSGSLVPYQIYHAEDGKLVPYQLFKCISTEEELSRIAQLMQDEYPKSKVDLLNRPQIDAAVMNAAGWDVPEGSYSTVDTVTYTYNDFGLSGDYAINVTPILDDGTVIDGGVDGLWQHISDELNNGNQFEDLDIFLGKYNTVEEAEAAAQRLHELQEDYYALKEETAENKLVLY